jgi:hypothetical protein
MDILHGGELVVRVAARGSRAVTCAKRSMTCRAAQSAIPDIANPSISDPRYRHSLMTP